MTRRYSSHIGRAPHGARGLKQAPLDHLILHRRRAPHGARGLKQRLTEGWGAKVGSRPARGAWIETIVNHCRAPHMYVAPRTGRVD